MMKIMEMMAVLFMDTVTKACRRIHKRIEDMEEAVGKFLCITGRNLNL